MKIESVIGPIGFDEHNYRRRPLSMIDTIMMHRVDEGEDAISVAAWFAKNGIASGAGTTNMPYMFVITRDGRIQQTAPLAFVTPHGRSWNPRSIGVACIGNFRKNQKGGAPPTSQQLDAAAWLCRRLWDYFGKPLKVVGHSSSPGASKWGAAHNCPGDLFPLDSVIEAARALGEIVRTA